MRINIRKSGKMYVAWAFWPSNAKVQTYIDRKGVSPRQALARLVESANLHGQTVTVSVQAPDKAIAPLRAMAIV